MSQYFQALLWGSVISVMGSQRIGVVMPRLNQKDLSWLAERCEEGKIVPVIDKIYPLHEVPDAVRHLEEGRARGKVVISLV